MQKIEDYALIGDCRSAALVSRTGAIDWLCWPSFDSQSVFARLLDEHGGHWSISPTEPSRASRRYAGETNVLETSFVTDTGTLVVTDWMSVASEEQKLCTLLPAHEICRVVECTRGSVRVHMRYEPRPGYGDWPVRIAPTVAIGVRLEAPGGLLTLLCDLPLTVLETSATAELTLTAGERRYCSLGFSGRWPAVLPTVRDATNASLERSLRWWEQWASGLRYDGPERAAVIRSALLLKLLIFAPSGAVIAAPTTSLPERVGGDLNWDYRYCWLRDASLTVRALLSLGCEAEADAFLSWLLHATRLTQPELKIFYDVYGNLPDRERVLPRFEGYRGSRPVRVGNEADQQLQLDVYGEVIDAAAQVAETGRQFDRETQRVLWSLGEHVVRHWQKDDEGIREPRTGKRPHTHSRLLCWVALDRLLLLCARGVLSGRHVERFERCRAEIRRDIELHAWSERLQSYVATLDGDALDASLLLLAWYGFERANSPRMQLTRARLRAELCVGNGLYYRYPPGPSGEGAFGICSFWAAEISARAGETRAAEKSFSSLCGFANDVGLLGEEIDPSGGGALGNFPQGFTHVGLINAGMSLRSRT